MRITIAKQLAFSEMEEEYYLIEIVLPSGEIVLQARNADAVADVVAAHIRRRLK